MPKPEYTDPRRLATVRRRGKHGTRVLRVFADWEMRGWFYCTDDDPDAYQGRGLVRRGLFDTLEEVREFFGDEAGREPPRRARLLDGSPPPRRGRRG